MALGQGGFSFLDFDKEDASTSFWTGAVTAVSLPGLLTQFGALRTAIAGICIGTITDERLRVFETPLSNTPPSDPQAQRETKWFVDYEDSQQFFDPPVNAIPNAGYKKTFSIELPTADLSLLTGNTSVLDITAGAGATFKTAFEAIARSPYGGTVTVLEVRHVGRNT